MTNSDTISGFTGNYRFLSNFWMMPIYFGPWRFASAEHAYQAAKSEDPKDWERIQSCAKPGEAKRMGQTLELRPNWDKLKLGIMEDILSMKFQHPRLRQMLLDTVDAELIETNTWGDTYWGVCKGKGVNHLGNLLMAERLKLLVQARGIFVFGSNTAGRHGKGAALTARKTRGATQGLAEGRSGQSYALPTADPYFRPLPLTMIQDNVDRFIIHAQENPSTAFQVTRVGCGLVGYSDDVIAPMFTLAGENCFFDTAWQPYLPPANFWGTF